MVVGASASLLPELATVRAARDRLRGVIRHTPLQPSPWLTERVGAPVHLKLECWQVTGSFKVRGALNAVASLDDAARRPGLVAASAGNHGLAVALAARRHGIPATIFVPSGAPETKKRRIQRLGAELREVAGIYDDAARAARAFAEGSGARMIHAFDDPAVVAGQGTVALEILEELPDVGAVVVPVGGGGLAAGVGAALRAAGSDALALGVQSAATRAMHDAFEAGRVVPSEDAPSLCDGLAGETEPGAYRRARAALHDLRLVEEASIGPAIRSLFEEEGVVAEGSGAVGIAALLTGVISAEGPVAVVVSGGNIDGRRLARILQED